MRRKVIVISVVFCLVLIAQRGKAYAQEEAEPKFKVIDTAFCSEADMDFDNKWCSNSKVKFPVDVGRLYCCTKIFAREDGDISHNWIFEGEPLTPVRLNVSRSPGYRTRSVKTLFPKHIGNWKVEVEAEGEVLVTLPITITPSEEPTEEKTEEPSEEPEANTPSVSPDNNE
jgi:hypothetical protein